LASDYLGGNLYNNARDFIKESGGYYEEMVFNAITEAAEVINKLGA
jgi:hypothetical protein